MTDILVTGATGLTGGAIVRRLSARGVPVRALTRDPAAANAAALADLDGVQILQGDMAEADSLRDALRGVERAMLISSSDVGMAEVQSAFIDAAARAGVQHVVKLSGIIPDLDSPFRFARMHGEVELHLEHSGMAYTNLRAGEFMTSYFRQIPNIVEQGALLLPMADARIASIDVGDLAEVAADILTGDGHAGATYPLTGPEALTMTEVAAKLTTATGLPIRYVDVPPEDTRRAQLAAGFPPYLADGLFELFAERRAGKEATVFPVIADVFGRTPTTFDAFAARNAAAFRGEGPPAAA